MKRILIVSDEEDVELVFIPKREVHHLNLIGKRFTKVLVDKELFLNEEEIMDLRISLYNPYDLKDIMYYDEEEY